MTEQLPALNEVIPLPSVVGTDRLDLQTEIDLMRSAVGALAQQGQMPSLAKCLEQLAALEKANLKLRQQAEGVLSKTRMHELVDQLLKVISDITDHAIPPELRAHCHEIIRQAKNGCLHPSRRFANRSLTSQVSTAMATSASEQVRRCEHV